MPSRKQSRNTRSRRQSAARQRQVRQQVNRGEPEYGEEAEPVMVAAPQPPSPAARVSAARPAARTRTRAPAQIVIANYDFLRHDLRLLVILAPSLVIVMVVLSFVIH